MTAVRRIRQTFALCCAVLALLTLFAQARTAPRPRTITGFEPLDAQEASLYFPFGAKPSPDELAALFPHTLRAYVDGADAPVSIEVGWSCAAGEFEGTDYYYYQFSPVWDEAQYRLSESLDLLRDAPYVGVFLTEDAGAALMEGTQTNEERVFSYLTQTLGLNAAAACGVMTNIYAESAFVPNNLQGSFEGKLGYTDASYTAAVDSGSYTGFVHDGAGYGLCQWTYSTRKQGLLELARARGVSVGDLAMQLDYMRSEMSSGLVRYLRGISNTADGAYQAAAYFCRVFEQPSDTENAAKVRGNLAVNRFWPQYASPDASAYVGRVTASPSLTINDIPAASSEGKSTRLGGIPYGELCVVYPGGSVGIWRWVSYNGIQGYSHGSYIEYVCEVGTAIISADFSGGVCSASVSCAGGGATVLFAGYGGDGRMLALRSKAILGSGNYSAAFDASVRYVTILVTGANHAPLCAALTVRRR